MCAPKTYWAPRADRTSVRFCPWVRRRSHFMFLGLSGWEKQFLLLLGTEASCSCPALLPLSWNVNKPAAETKHNGVLCSAQGPGRRGPSTRGRGNLPCISIIPGDELFSGVVTSEPHFSSLPFFLFLFFWRRKWSRNRVTKSHVRTQERDPGGVVGIFYSTDSSWSPQIPGGLSLGSLGFI